MRVACIVFYISIAASILDHKTQKITCTDDIQVIQIHGFFCRFNLQVGKPLEEAMDFSRHPHSLVFQIPTQRTPKGLKAQEIKCIGVQTADGNPRYDWKTNDVFHVSHRIHGTGIFIPTNLP